MSKAPKKAVLFYRTIVLSDVHLGAPDCQIDKVNHFLKRTHSEKLILNGDIIDSWSLGRSGGWTKKAHALYPDRAQEAREVQRRDDLLERQP